MAYSAVKILAFGGVAVAGGGITGGLIIPSLNRDKSTSKTSTEEKKVKITPKKCFIFVGEKATSAPEKNQEVKLSRIIEKFKDIEEFLKSKNIEEGVFKNSVKDACKGLKKEVDNTKENLNVYVYQEGGQTWSYTEALQKGDWINNQEIKENSQSVINS